MNNSPLVKRLIASLLVVTSLALAESHEELIDRAFQAVEDDLSARWSYTRTEEDQDGVYVGRYDPRQPESERWTLITVDGREPSAEETEDYLAERNREPAGDNDDDEKELNSMVEKGSAVLLEETDSFWLFGFKPRGDTEDDRAFMESVDGTLKIVKDGHYVAEIALQNSSPIKPAKGVKIKAFFTRLAFAPIEDGGPALPRSVQASIQGKAFFVMNIDESETVTFSEFEQVLDPAPQP
jgi:hypothetical protein